VTITTEELAAWIAEVVEAARKIDAAAIDEVSIPLRGKFTPRITVRLPGGYAGGAGFNVAVVYPSTEIPAALPLPETPPLNPTPSRRGTVAHWTGD